MTILKTMMAVGAVLVILAGPARAADIITVTDAYAFAVPEGAPTAAAFMTMTYPPAPDGTSPDRLMKVESSIAALTEVHTSIVAGDVMQMRKLENLPLSPLGAMNFTPRGMHVMFLELNQPLVIGSSFPLILTFEKAGSITAEVQVRAPGDVPASSDTPDAHNHH